MKKTLIGLSVVAIVAQGFTTIKNEPAKSNSLKTSVNKEVLQNAAKGKEIYTKVCGACHQATGLGLPGAFPPLAGSDYLNKDASRAIKTVLNGLTGEVVVNGKKFNSVMPSQKTLSDQDIADVLTYVYSSWGKSKKVVKPSDVKSLR